MCRVCTGAFADMLAKLRLIVTRAKVVTDVPSIVVLGLGPCRLSGCEIIVESGVVIGSVFIVKLGENTVEVLTDEWTEVITSGGPAIGAKVRASGMAAATAALVFALPASSGAPL